MYFIDFEGANSYLGEPEDWDEEKHGPCDTLPVQVTDKGVCISMWRPSSEELAALNEGAAVCLMVIGGQPPVALGAAYVEEKPKVKKGVEKQTDDAQGAEDGGS